MKMNDVFHVDRWMRMLAEQKVALQVAGRRKNERPKDGKSRGQFIHEFMLRYVSTIMMHRKKDRYMIHQSWVAAFYPPSVALLGSLKKLYLKDLYLETHHRGFYALLRVATPSVTMTAVMAIMEDEKDDGMMFQLYQQEDENHQPDEEAVQMQRVCVVKESYFKMMNDGGYGLRVDHFNDVIWLFPDDERIFFGWRARISEFEKTAETLKEKGNLVLKAGKLNTAVESYTSAFHRSTAFEMSQILKLNRSLINLKLRHYDEILEDAGKFTADVQQSEKGFYRAALFLYELKRFRENHQALASFISHYPRCHAAKKEIIRTKQRLRKQEHDGYDFRAMYRAAKDTPPYFDNATFAGNVEVQTSKSRGRGLFTTKDVIVGELLFCEKAFSYCSSKHSKTSILINTHTNQATLGTQADLITNIVQKIFRSPSSMPVFTSLYHGDYEPVDEAEADDMPIIDTFLVDRIVFFFNIFGCPRTSLENHSAKLTSEPHHHTCGIFIKASHINHSCYSNARRNFIDDMQIVRATRNISAGSKIIFWYVILEPNYTYEKTQEKLQNWGFQCTCAICQQGKKMKKNVSSKRLALLKNLKTAFGNRTDADLPKAERILNAVEKTYTELASEVPRLALWHSYLLFTRIYCSKNQQNKMIETAWKVLKSFGFKIKRQNPLFLQSSFEVEQWGLMKDCLIQIWVHLWTAYAQVAPGLCKKAEEYAKITYKICIGENDTFDETYGKLAHQAMFEGIDLGEAFQSMIFMR